MERSTKTLNLLDLPVELLTSITNVIPAEDQRSSVRLVCRALFNAVEMPHFNLGVILPSEMDQLVQLFGRYKKPISLTFRKPYKLSVDDMARLSSLTQLASLSASEAYIDGDTLALLTNLKSLAADKIKTSPTACLARFSKLESLSLANQTAEWTNMAHNLVTSLTIKSLTSPPEEWLDQFKRVQSLNLIRLAKRDLLHFKLPTDLCRHLTSLSVDGVFIENNADIPWHQLKTLSLKLSPMHMYNATLNYISKCTNATKIHINHLSSQAMIDALDVTPLKHLEDFYLPIGGGAPFGSVKDFLPQLNKDSLKKLYLTIWHDHEECFAEISKMTKLEDLHIYVRHATLEYEPVDLSALMTMTNLTSLRLSGTTAKAGGLENITNLTNLNALRLSLDNTECPLNELSLSSFSHLTYLRFQKVAKVVDIRGISGLESLHLHMPNCPEGALKYIPEEISRMREISIDELASVIPWTDLAQCPALETIAVSSFNTDDSVLALTTLKHLTSLGNVNMYSQRCVHFDANHLVHLTRLQNINITVPQTNVAKPLLEQNLPMLWSVIEKQCVPCLKKNWQEPQTNSN